MDDTNQPAEQNPIQTVDPAAPPAAETRSDGGEGAVTSGAPSPPPSPPPAPKVDWKVQQLQSRVAKLTAQKRELEAALSAKQAGGAAPAATDEATLQALIEAKAEALAETKAEAKASVKAAQNQFDRDCNDAVVAGRRDFGTEEFNSRLASLVQIVENADVEVQQQYTNFVAAMIETGAPAKLIYELGQDLNEATRLMRLSPVKQGIELAKLALREPEGISKAPKPISPVGNKGRSHEAIDPKDPSRSDNLSIDAWMARRNEQVAETNKRVGRRVL